VFEAEPSVEGGAALQHDEGLAPIVGPSRDPAHQLRSDASPLKVWGDRQRGEAGDSMARVALMQPDVADHHMAHDVPVDLGDQGELGHEVG